MDNGDKDYVNDIYSSPIPQRSLNVGKGLDLIVDDFFEESKPKKSSKKTQKKVKKGKVEDVDEIALWSPAKRQSWEARKTNPNAFYYRHVEPGQVKRTGPWDDTEKEAFMRAIKLHPPTQGKWGLFAMNIPGRVGYQCRNFYHRLLESGELQEDSVPGEKLEKPQKRQRAPKGSKKQTSSKKKSKHVVESESDEMDIEQEIANENERDEASEASDAEVAPTPKPIQVPVEAPKAKPKKQKKNQEIVEQQQEQDQKQQEEQEEPVVGAVEAAAEAEQAPVEEEMPQFNISSLKLFSSRIQREDELLKKRQEEHATVLDDIKSLDDFDAPPSEVVEAAVETIERLTEQEQKTEERNDPQVKWSPRMKNPWATVNASQTIEFPHDKKLDRQQYEYQCSRIMSYNTDSPLNLLLLSFPAPQDLRKKYIRSVRHRLANNESGGQFSSALRAYFVAKKQCLNNPAQKEEICRDFVTRFLNHEL